MKLSGTAELHAPVERVYAALADPSVLVRTIPGCQQLETVGDGTYKMTVTAGVASIKGTYLGSVQIVDQDPPHGYTLKASGQSAAGSIDASAKIKLSGNGAGTTLLGYDADAVVAGAIGGVGQRMLTGVAKKLAAEFFTAVDHDLGYGPPAEAAEAAAPAVSAAQSAAGPAVSAVPAAGAVYRRPEQPRPQAPTGLLLFAAAAFGAAVAFAGVALGGRLARGSQRSWRS